ncbi:MAG: sensor histidine kinase, partial [Phycisphaerae bacterium]
KFPSLDSGELPRLSGSVKEPDFRIIKGSGGRVERATGFSFIPRLSDSDRNTAEPQPLTLTVARDSTVILSQLRFLRWVLFCASGVVTLLSVLVTLLTVRQGLRPLTAIAGEIAAINESDLSTRIGIPSVPAEILPIKNRLNDLLSRLEDAFKRERRFTADVAHELRTPLAGMRSTLEVTLARIRDAKEYQASLSDCLAISRNMQRMVDNLLTLARLDAHQIRFRRVRIQPAKLVNSCWRPFSDRALEREIVFDNRIPAEMTCESDPENLSTALSNLLDNAVEYTNDAGQIWVTAHHTDDSIEINVANTGCKLTSEQASQVFDCFWRGDSSRKDAGVHCGLGLALVQRIVRALGGSTSADVQAGGIFTVRLILPVIQESHHIQ